MTEEVPKPEGVLGSRLKSYLRKLFYLALLHPGQRSGVEARMR